jgi:putative transposase
VVRKRRYETLGSFLEEAERWINFYNNRRPHESIGQMAPNEYAKKNGFPIVPYLTNLTVQ